MVSVQVALSATVEASVSKGDHLSCPHPPTAFFFFIILSKA